MREIIKLGVILLVITAVAATLLAVANNATVDLIAAAQEKSNNEALKEVLSQAESFTPLDREKLDEILVENKNVIDIYIGKNGAEEVVGYAIKTISSGYGGDIEVMTGISVDGEITGMKVVSHSETPGLGENAAKPQFQNQFLGKSATSKITVAKSAPKDNEIQAIAGATITSNSVSNAVNDAIDVFSKLEK